MPLSIKTDGRLAPTDVAYELNNFTRTIELDWLHILICAVSLGLPANQFTKPQKARQDFLKKSIDSIS